MGQYAKFMLYNLITITAGIILLNDAPFSKDNIKKTGLEILIWAALSTAVFYALMMLFQHMGWRNHYVSRITVSFALALYAFTRSRVNIETKVTTICVLYVATFHLEFIRVLVISKVNMSSAGLFTLSFITYLAIITGTSLFLKRFTVRGVSTAPKVFCFIILFITAASEFCILNLNLKLWMDGLDEDTAIMLGVLTLGLTFYVFNMVVYYMYYVMAVSYTRQSEMALMRQKQSEAVSELDRANRLYDEISVMRHEYKNRILSMEILLKSKQYDKLEKNFRSCLSADSEVMTAINCGNRVLNSIFNVKQNDCKNNGVSFDVLAAVPAQLPFEDADLVSLLVNLVDNAMEGTISSEHPSVSVKMNVENNYLFITVINPVAGKVLERNPALSTTKKDKAVHGIGLRVVKSIVKKYNGHIKFEQVNNIFTTSLMLEMTPQEQMAAETAQKAVVFP